MAPLLELRKTARGIGSRQANKRLLVYIFGIWVPAIGRLDPPIDGVRVSAAVGPTLVAIAPMPPFAWIVRYARSEHGFPQYSAILGRFFGKSFGVDGIG